MLIQINVFSNNEICLASLTLIDAFCLYTPAFESTEKSILLHEKKEHWKLQIVLYLQQKRLFEWLASDKWKVPLYNHTKHWRTDKPIYIWDLRPQANPIRKGMRQDKRYAKTRIHSSPQRLLQISTSHLSLRVNPVCKQLCNDGLQKYTRTLFINVFPLKMHTNYTLNRCYIFHALYRLYEWCKVFKEMLPFEHYD